MSIKKGFSICAVLFLAYSVSCIEPIDIIEDVDSGKLVVDGLITDEPGPYTVKLTRSRTIKSDLDNPSYVQGALVLLQDDTGRLDTLVERMPGRYLTDSTAVRGVRGRKYRLQIKTRDQFVYESDYQEILPVGTIDSAYFQLKKRTFINEMGGEEPKYDFDLYANASFPSAQASFALWRWTGTYEILTFPKLRDRVSSNDPDYNGLTVTLPDPPKCSGYIFLKDLFLESGLGYYAVSSECTCCRCWVNQYSTEPKATNNEFASSRLYDIALGSISAQDDEPFRFKYRVTVEMLSVSEDIFQYWQLMETQLDNSIFVPPSGKLRGNIHSLGQAPEAYGTFRAASVAKKSFFIPSRSLPFGINSPADSIAEDCRKIKNATNVKPASWD